MFWRSRKRRLGVEGESSSGGSRSQLELEDGSRVAVIGGGPAGSFFAYFLLDMARRVGISIHVDVYEPHDFSVPGPANCNMCGGVISESLVQSLAAEGINLPPAVMQRGIDSYMLHTPEGSVRIDTPVRDKRIAAVHRGAGPRGIKETKWDSFDRYLLELATAKGCHPVQKRVDEIRWKDDRPQIGTRDGSCETYDLLAFAVGVNTATRKLFDGLGFGFRPPRTTRTYICEFDLGYETVRKWFGNSMHVFLLNIPRLEFAALIPKGDYVTLCLLGRTIDQELVQSFLQAAEVRQCFPPDWAPPDDFCHCSPRINIRGAIPPFSDRLVFIGDCGVTRLFKDGIGAAYRTAKAAASTAVFAGISAKDFRRHYWPVCRAISRDNTIGRMIFAFTHFLQGIGVAGRGILAMVSREQRQEDGRRRMSLVLWDTFTGSAPYRQILLRMFHPFFLARLMFHVMAGLWLRRKRVQFEKHVARTDALGKVFQDGDVIVGQGQMGDCMYVIQSGRVEVVQQKGGAEVRLAVLEAGDFFGEMALFEREARSATVRAIGEVRVITVDQKALLHRVHDDPSLAFRIIQDMSARIRKMNAEMTRMKSER